MKKHNIAVMPILEKFDEEGDGFMIDRMITIDENKTQIRVSYFQDYHYKNEIILDLSDLI